MMCDNEVEIEKLPMMTKPMIIKTRKQGRRIPVRDMRAEIKTVKLTKNNGEKPISTKIIGFSNHLFPTETVIRINANRVINFAHSFESQKSLARKILAGISDREEFEKSVAKLQKAVVSLSKTFKDF